MNEESRAQEADERKRKLEECWEFILEGQRLCREINKSLRKYNKNAGNVFLTTALGSNVGHCAICLNWGLNSKHHSKPSHGGLPRRGPIWWICKQCHTTVHTHFTNAELVVLWNEPDNGLSVIQDTINSPPQ